MYAPHFCENTDCEDKWRRNTGRKANGKEPESEVVRVGKALAFDNLYDPVRDIVREEIRQTITQRVKDNVLGMTELLSDLLPLVLNGVAVDLQSDDVFVRQKAQALILKYVMPLQHETPVADDSRTLNVIHRVAVPDTILGEAVEAEAAALPPGVEAFEADWPVCKDCGERKNPGTGNYSNPDKGSGNEFWCNACMYRATTRLGYTDPTVDSDMTKNLLGE